MNKLAEWGRWLRLETELIMPPQVRQSVMLSFHDTKEFVRLLTRPYLTIYQWQGVGQGGPLQVNYAGLGDGKSFLKDILFIEKPTESQIGRIPIWRMSELTRMPMGDITIVELDQHLVRRLPGQDALVLPVFVKMILDVEGDWDEVEGRFHKSIRSERRLIRKYNYEYTLSYNYQDLYTFYHHMYLPTMMNRHGDSAIPLSFKEAHQYFRRGALFLVKRDGQYVSGSLCYFERDVVNFIIMGVFQGNQQLMKEGAVGVLNYLRLQWVNQRGYRTVNFGWYRPFMKNMFLNKRKWGAIVNLPNSLKGRFWIKFQQNNPAVSRFLQNNPCIIIDETDQLYGLITLAEAELAKPDYEVEWQKQFVTPGLAGLFFSSTTDLVEKPVSHMFNFKSVTSTV